MKAFAILGVGESSIQYALSPTVRHRETAVGVLRHRGASASGLLISVRLMCVSMCSALGQHASIMVFCARIQMTGYLLEFITAKRGFGNEIKNLVTKVSACFDPSLDYVSIIDVIPR